MKAQLIAIVAAGIGMASCSASDLAYLTEPTEYSDQNLPTHYIDCPTGQIEIERGVRNNQAFNLAKNHTQHRVMVQFESRFGGGDTVYADAGEQSETIWRDVVASQNTGINYQCEGLDR